MRRHLFIFISLSCFIFTQAPVAGAEEFSEYYVSLRADEANVRTGPSARYPIKWVFKRKHWPVKVIATFEQWRKIRDRDGQEGWMHEILLSRKRYGIIKGGDIIKGYRLPIPTAAPTVMFEEDVVVALNQCKSDWCKVSTSGHEAWLESDYIWGMEKGELF